MRWTGARGEGYWDAPNPARVHHVIVAGEPMFLPDEQVAARVLAACPGWATSARRARAWMLDQAQVAARAGLDQFVDLGCGFPVHRSVYEAAGAVTAGARAVFVDHDPLVVTHVRCWWSMRGRAGVVGCDVRDGDDLAEVFSGKSTAGVGLDPDLPVAVTMCGLLEALTDAEVAGLFALLGDLLAPGSRVVFTHFSGAAEAAEIWRSLLGPFHPRTRHGLEHLLYQRGWEPLPAGAGPLGMSPLGMSPLGRGGRANADVGVVTGVVTR
jgi:hypothetical protein